MWCAETMLPPSTLLYLLLPCASPWICSLFVSCCDGYLHKSSSTTLTCVPCYCDKCEVTQYNKQIVEQRTCDIHEIVSGSFCTTHQQCHGMIGRALLINDRVTVAAGCVLGKQFSWSCSSCLLNIPDMFKCSSMSLDHMQSLNVSAATDMLQLVHTKAHGG